MFVIYIHLFRNSKESDLMSDLHVFTGVLLIVILAISILSFAGESPSGYQVQKDTSAATGFQTGTPAGGSSNSFCPTGTSSAHSYNIKAYTKSKECQDSNSNGKQLKGNTPGNPKYEKIPCECLSTSYTYYTEIVDQITNKHKSWKSHNTPSCFTCKRSICLGGEAESKSTCKKLYTTQEGSLCKPSDQNPVKFTTQTHSPGPPDTPKNIKIDVTCYKGEQKCPPMVQLPGEQYWTQENVIKSADERAKELAAAEEAKKGSGGTMKAPKYEPNKCKEAARSGGKCETRNYDGVPCLVYKSDPCQQFNDKVNDPLSGDVQRQFFDSQQNCKEQCKIANGNYLPLGACEDTKTSSQTTTTTISGRKATKTNSLTCYGCPIIVKQ